MEATADVDNSKVVETKGDVANCLTAAIQGDSLNAESADSAVHDGTLPHSDNVSMPRISAASVPSISVAPPVTIPLQWLQLHRKFMFYFFRQCERAWSGYNVNMSDNPKDNLHGSCNGEVSEVTTTLAPLDDPNLDPNDGKRYSNCVFPPLKLPLPGVPLRTRLHVRLKHKREGRSKIEKVEPLPIYHSSAKEDVVRRQDGVNDSNPMRHHNCL